MVVPKPGRGDALRFCVDLRDVNDLTVPIKYPFPLIKDVIESLAGAKYFIKLDLAKGFWQVPVELRTQ